MGLRIAQTCTKTFLCTALKQLLKRETADGNRRSGWSVHSLSQSAHDCGSALVGGKLKIGCQWNLSAALWRYKQRISGCRQVFYQSELECFTGRVGNTGRNK